ncbi:MAG: lysophospholipid acyltransferase family protein [Bacteroidota bacterium]
MKVIRAIYSIYVLLVFVLGFILLFPFFLIPIIDKRRHKLVGVFNRVWSRFVFTLTLLPYESEYRERLDRKKTYVFCPNHFSYWDIPTLGLNRHNASFVGKSSVAKVPIFGFMYSNLHIMVDRSSLKSRYATLIKTQEAVDDGRSLVIFPEGGMFTKKPPIMTRFKDGPFRLAIEKQIPIVPVTIPYNWIILPDVPRPLFKRGKVKAIYHEPIETTGLTLSDVDTLKSRVYSIIDDELKGHFSKHEH